LDGNKCAVEGAVVKKFWDGKRVLITGHTGFKGSWLSLWLEQAGAQVFGLALEPYGSCSLFGELGLAASIDHMVGDIRDADLVAARVKGVQPHVVFHLAAQSLVLAGYDNPLMTWQTNVLGSAHVIEALRRYAKPCAVVMVTTDKVYENLEDGRAYREGDALGGHDPYSASKAAMEIAVSSWRKSFLGNTAIRMASARAGNVIGGGDWAENRIMPDIVRSLARGDDISVRNPGAVRPWQHVLEPLAGYITLAERLWVSDDPALQSGFNFGPSPSEARPVRDLVTTALQHWPGKWHDISTPGAHHEAALLGLDTTKARDILKVRPRWNFEQAVEHTIKWYRAANAGASIIDQTRAQIRDFETL